MILDHSHRGVVVCLVWSAVALAGLPSARAQVSLPAPLVGGPPAQTETLPDPQIVVWTDSLTNTLPATAHNPGEDEFMVGWTTEQDQWSHDIWARRMRPDGTLSEHFNVANAAGQQLGWPEIAYCPLHAEYLVAYTNRYDGSIGRADVQARRVTWDGGLTGDIFTITPQVAEHLLPAIAYCGPCDEYVVTYTNQWPGGEQDLYAQLVRGADGALLDMNYVASGGGWDRAHSQVAFHPDMYGGAGGYLITYSAEAPSPSTEVRIRYKMAHTELYDLFTNPELEASSTPAALVRPQLDDGESVFLVAWWESTAGGYQVRARRISAEGVALGPPEGFPVSGEYVSPPMVVRNLGVAYAFGQRFLVLWEHSPLGDTPQIHAILVSEETDTTVGNEMVLSDVSGYALSPRVACSPMSDCLAVYMFWSPPGTYDIAGRILRLVEVFSDGFESGDASAWSATVP